jgi:hypothetical protein
MMLSQIPYLVVLPAFVPLFTFTISTPTSASNLRTLANAAGYTGGDAQATLAGALDMPGGMVPGTFPAGVIVTLIIPSNSFISGAGGYGGSGVSLGCVPPPGGTGGTALDARSTPGYTFRVQNNGTLRGGGGGGTVGTSVYQCPIGWCGGGGGGGGQGNPGGAPGGAQGGASYGGGNGTAGSVAGPGLGGIGGGTGGVNYGGTGGNGGTFGTAGGAGANVGGAAGYAVQGNANIVWLVNGTKIGPVA